MDKPENRAHVTRTPDFKQLEGTAQRLGGMLFQTPRGDVALTDAPGYMTAVVDHQDPELMRITFILYEPPGPGETVGQGMACQMDPLQARNIAQSLLRLADAIEQGTFNG